MTKEPLPGPFKSTTTKTVELTPIKFTVTEVIESTHAPAPCGCNETSGFLDRLVQIAQDFAAQQAGARPGPWPPGPVEENDPSATSP